MTNRNATRRAAPLALDPELAALAHDAFATASGLLGTACCDVHAFSRAVAAPRRAGAVAALIKAARSLALARVALERADREGADTRVCWSAWEGAEIAMYDACGRLGVAPASKAG